MSRYARHAKRCSTEQAEADAVRVDELEGAARVFAERGVERTAQGRSALQKSKLRPEEDDREQPEEMAALLQVDAISLPQPRRSKASSPASAKSGG